MTHHDAKRVFCTALSTVLLLSGSCVLASVDPLAPGNEAASEYRAGLQAFADGLPQVAVKQMAVCLDSHPPPELRRNAILTSVQASVSLGEGAAALALLDKQTAAAGSLENDAAILFWRGQALAVLGRWDDALAAYSRAVSGDTGMAVKARFGRGEALLALNRKPEAFGVFQSLAEDPFVGEQALLRGAEIALDSNRLKDAAALLRGNREPGQPRQMTGTSLLKKRRFLIGRLRLAQKQTALAERIFSGLAAQPEGLTERLLTASFWGWAQACLEQGKLAEAEDVLESFVGNYPRTTYLKGTLAWLTQLYDRNPQLPNLADLRRWAADTAEPSRQASSLLMLAHVEETLGRPDRAETVLQAFSEAFPNDPLRIRATLDLANLRLRQNHPAEAREALDRARKLDPVSAQSETDMLAARLSLAEHNSAEAAGLFESIANRPNLTGAQAEAAAFNAVLGWLRASDTSRFTVTERTFLERFPDSPFGAELSLEEGLARAARTAQDDRNGRQRAAAALRHFLRDNPDHPRATEARIVLAELAFERPYPNLTAAWHELAAPEFRRVDNPIVSPGENPAENDRAAYLAIWLTDTPGPTQDAKRAIALAASFLERRPDSPLAPEVRMKLCEIYFRNEDYSDAQTQLELLVEKAPDSPLVEPALYLAGLAASRSMSNTGLDQAVPLFEKAARLGGPFKLSARLRQAELQKRLGNLQDALTLYKEVLTATATSLDLTDADLDSRCAALAGRGETLLMLGAREPKYYEDAAQSFDQLANHTPHASLLWRRQALTQKGSAYEKAGDPTSALAAYDEALNAGDPPDTTSREPEWTWFYRAGRNATELLKARSQWQSAIVIYKKLAAADGPLKNDYENLLSRLRLEHFIWEN